MLDLTSCAQITDDTIEGVVSWVRSTFGRIFSGASEGWEKNITAQDPDPVSWCSFWIVTLLNPLRLTYPFLSKGANNILDGWAVNGNVGCVWFVGNERLRSLSLTLPSPQHRMVYQDPFLLRFKAMHTARSTE